MLINWQAWELNLKVIYYSPALRGKTSNLVQIHARVDPQQRNEMISLKTSENRTSCFDFLRLDMGVINILIPRFQLYTVPGQTFYEASRKWVLCGVVVAVCVADGAVNRLRHYMESWKKMMENHASFGMSIFDLPIVGQFNKPGFSNAIPQKNFQNLLLVEGHPISGAVAVRNKGLSETLKATTRGVITRVQYEHA